MIDPRRAAGRPYETGLLLLAGLVGLAGFFLAAAGMAVAERIAAHPGGAPAGPIFTPTPGLVLPVLYVLLGAFAVHFVLLYRRARGEQLLLPIVTLLLLLSLVMIYRLRGLEAVWQQLLRGFTPGLLVCLLLAAQPRLVERLRRLAVPASLLGLALPFMTALFGEVDETGVRLALKLGPLPSIQTSEIIKLALVLFLAWYIERQARQVEGRARPLLGWLRLPPLGYFVPGALFTALGALALVAMSDYGAVIILGFIFIAMLYAGFEGRTFLTVAAIGAGLALLAGMLIALTWQVPDLVRYRFIAYRDPWSSETISVNGQPGELTVSQGPGYQIQQAIYAVAAGGLGGAGLGLGSPYYVPLAHSDFIFAAILEEMGSAVGMALLALYGVLFLRLLRLAARLPAAQVFERLLLVGCVAHLFIQVFYMVGGTLNLVPVTGITVPFLSLGGTALLVNLVETGLALGLLQRVEG
ncbi:MAG: FtsW/RodA/SpoVE family cell cycle protein [Chloroflexota bacterium]